MNIEELQKDKLELELKIKDLLKSFEDKYNKYYEMPINTIRFERWNGSTHCSGEISRVLLAVQVTN